MEVFSTNGWSSAKSSDKSALGSTLMNLVAPNTPSLLDILTDSRTVSLRSSLELKCRDLIMAAISETIPNTFCDDDSEAAYSSPEGQLEVQTSAIAEQIKIDTDLNGDVKTEDMSFAGKSLVPSASDDIVNDITVCTVMEDSDTIHHDVVPLVCSGKNVTKDVTEVSIGLNPPLTNSTESPNSPVLETTDVSLYSSIAGTSTKGHNTTLENEVSDISPVTSVMEDQQSSPEVLAPANFSIIDTSTEVLDLVHTFQVETCHGSSMMPEDHINSPIIQNTESPVTLSTTVSSEDVEGNLPTIEISKAQLILSTEGIVSEDLVSLTTQCTPEASISSPEKVMAEDSSLRTLPTRDMAECYTNSPSKLATENPITPTRGTLDAMTEGLKFLSTRLLTEVATNLPTKGTQEDSELLLARDTTEVHVNLPNQLDNASQGPSHERKYLEHSPLLFSEEDDDEFDEGLPQSSLLDEIRTAEETRLCKLRKFVGVGGVLPPPSITMPQLTADDMLGLIQRNTLTAATTEGPSPGSCEKMRLTCKSRLGQIKDSAWPDVKQCCFPDIYYNNGSMSEEFEALCVKYKERYVGNETASSCNVWFTLGTDSAKKRRRAGGPSPGRRLSHLASRRRQVFSKDNLFNISAANRELAAAERRKIHLDSKKLGQKVLLGKRRESRDPGPSGSNASTKVAHKRALFQSPDESEKRASTNSTAGVGYKNGDTGRNRSFKRALFYGPSEASGSHSNVSETNQQSVQLDAVPEKRPLVKHVPTTSRASPSCKSSKRKLSFVNDHHLGASTTCRPPASKPESKENNKVGANRTTDFYASSLDCNQRKKLMWALSQALRSVGIHTMHASFRSSVQALGRLCKTPIIEAVRNLQGHTSEVMLQVAMQHVAQLVTKKTSETGGSAAS